ncbi:MAG TPA: MarR family transcriptional regulator [Gemmatimonadaceae bacterium]|nr:MarR family transcriptional regulator [Gemmatimonadaceae bacterium]
MYYTYVNNVDVASPKNESSTDKSIFLLLHAARTLENRVEATLETVGLSMAKYSVVSELVSADAPVSLSELATRLSCVRSNMTQLVDRLEADGLVQRVDDPNDRRAVKAAITVEGRKRQAAGADAIAKLHEEFAASVDETDRDALGRLLTALK